MSDSADSSPIILPPTPKPGRTPAEDKARLQEWTRQAEQAIRKIHAQIIDLQSKISGGSSLPNGGSPGEVLAKRSAADGDATWSPTHYIPNGGSIGQALRKKSATDYDAKFADVHEVPVGGTTGQVLKKNSNTDYDAGFADVHEVPAGGRIYEVLSKTSDTDYATQWASVFGCEKSSVAIDLFNDYPVGPITVADRGWGWASPGRITNGAIVTRNMSGGRTENRLSLSGGQYGRTWNWGGDWQGMMFSVLLRLNGAATFSENYAFGISAGTSAMWADPSATNWLGIVGSNGLSGSSIPTWTYVAGARYGRFNSNTFSHAYKVGTTVTGNVGNLTSNPPCIPAEETHYLALSFYIPRNYTASPSTAYTPGYNYFKAVNNELHQEVGSWLRTLFASPRATGSDFQTLYINTASTFPTVTETTGAFDSLNFWWAGVSGIPAELAGVCAVRLY